MSGKTRYIFSSGALNRKDNTLSFRSDNGLTHLPIEGIKELYLMNEVSLNTKLLSFLSKNGVVVHFFDYYGHDCGSYYPRDKYLSGRLRVRQALAYTESRMPIATAFVEGIRDNMLGILKQKKAKAPEVLTPIVQALDSKKYREPCGDIKALLSQEGAYWQLFYEAINALIDPAFISDKRVKRPPDNPLNALISFGNSWLYSKTITQLYHTHLDQSISFLHEPSEGRFSLSLDVSEVFKIAIVFPVILNMVNRGMLRVGEHFEKATNFCHLNESGRKKYVIELEKALNKTFEHAKLGRQVTYETAIKYEGYKLSKYLIEGTPFTPFVKGRAM